MVAGGCFLLAATNKLIDCRTGSYDGRGGQSHINERGRDINETHLVGEQQSAGGSRFESPQIDDPISVSVSMAAHEGGRVVTGSSITSNRRLGG